MVTLHSSHDLAYLKELVLSGDISISEDFRCLLKGLINSAP